MPGFAGDDGWVLRGGDDGEYLGCGDQGVEERACVGLWWGERVSCVRGFGGCDGGCALGEGVGEACLNLQPYLVVKNALLVMEKQYLWER